MGFHLCRVRDAATFTELWPWIREGLMFLREKNPPRQKWLPEHLRKEVMLTFMNPPQAQTDCFVAHDVGAGHDRVWGHLFCFPQVDPFVALPLAWHVWMGFMLPTVLDALLPEFEDEARKRGYTSWQWCTSRTKWIKRAEKFGAKVVEFTISKPLYP
jgi:hypothetical protein